jgi:hypothetical protein
VPLQPPKVYISGPKLNGRLVRARALQTVRNIPETRNAIGRSASKRYLSLRQNGYSERSLFAVKRRHLLAGTAHHASANSCTPALAKLEILILLGTHFILEAKSIPGENPQVPSVVSQYFCVTSEVANKKWARPASFFGRSQPPRSRTRG